MHPLYEEALKLADRLKAARLEVASLTSELATVEYNLAVAKAKVERALIKQVGDEKRLGPTAESRERVFTLARDADQDYKAQAKRQIDTQARLERAKIEVAALRYQLTIILTAMRATEEGAG
jgi:hypothetical protein